jgi:hypothetical protein
MTKMPASLKWFDSNVKRTIRLQGQQGIARVAMLVRRQARRNLTENGQNDTKFLHNSIYVATPDKVTPVAPDGRYLSTKTGKMVERKSGPIVQPTDGAHVGVAAEYGIYPELENSFLYRAIGQVAGRQAEDAMAGLGTGIIVGDDE